MGNSRLNQNQQPNPQPSNDQPQGISYTNGAEKLNITWQGRAEEFWVPGTQSAVRALIEKINTPQQPSRAWIESSIHQYPPAPPTYSLPPTPATLMLSPAQDSSTPQHQTPNENTLTRHISPQAEASPKTASASNDNPDPQPAVVSTGIPKAPTAGRLRISKQTIDLWRGRAVWALNAGLVVFIVYLVFFEPTTSRRFWAFFSPSSQQSQPAKNNAPAK